MLSYNLLDDLISPDNDTIKLPKYLSLENINEQQGGNISETSNNFISEKNVKRNQDRIS